MVRLVSHREYGEVGAPLMLLPTKSETRRDSRLWAAAQGVLEEMDDRALYYFCRDFQHLYIQASPHGVARMKGITPLALSGRLDLRTAGCHESAAV